MSSGLEIERKFLVEGDDYKRLAFDKSRIQQGYICSGHGRTVRVRIRDEQAFLTIKGPSLNGGLSRYEFEQEIPFEAAQDLLKLCEPGMIDKTRWLNEGLVMAEVELETEDEQYEKPDFIGEEVTGDRRFYNSHLRFYPYKVWK